MSDNHTSKPARQSLRQAVGLGRPGGVSALFEDTTEQASLPPTELDPREILPNPNQPRKYSDPAEQAELEADIAERGILQPLAVERLADGGFQLVAGERRRAAAIKLRLASVPVLVREYASREEVDVAAIAENVQRANMRFDDEAGAFRHLLDTYGWTVDRIAEQIHKTREYVRIRLTALEHPDLLGALLSGNITQPEMMAAIAERNRDSREQRIAVAVGGANDLQSSIGDSRRSRRPAPRRPHSGYRAWSNAKATAQKLLEVRERMDIEERREARRQALEVREAMDQFLEAFRDE
jgi:ParB family transcriptional regulator, chromosome partitioning protein